MTMRYVRTIAAALTLAAFLAGCHSVEVNPSAQSPYYPLEKLQAGSILHVPTGSLIAEEQLYSYLSGARIVYVGEAHDNLDHHKVQLRVIKALEERYPGSVSVGMEMFRSPSQPVLDKWVRGELEEREFYKEWLKNWGIDYDYYRDILEYVREKHIPLIALNASKEQIAAMTHKGGEGGFDRSTLPEIDPSDPYHRAMVEAVFYDPSHKSHGGGDFDKFYNMLLLWEESMAEAVSDHLTEMGGERRMVVLSGGGHINYGYGIPKRVFRRVSLPYTTIIPVSPAITNDKKLAKEKGVKLLDVDLPSAPLYLADFAWATGYTRVDTVRPKLGVQISERDGRVKVTGVADGSVAARVGIREGDIVASFDGHKISEIADLLYLVREKEFGDEVVVGIERDTEALTLEVKFKRSDEEGAG